MPDLSLTAVSLAPHRCQRIRVCYGWAVREVRTAAIGEMGLRDVALHADLFLYAQKPDAEIAI